MTTTTSTPALAAPNASGSLPISIPGVAVPYTVPSPVPGAPPLPVAAGTTLFKIFAGPPVAGQVGAYINPSPDFIGSWSLLRRMVGTALDPAGPALPNSAPQLVLAGDNTSLAFASTAPLATIAGADTIVLVVTARSAGSLTLSVVQ